MEIVFSLLFVAGAAVIAALAMFGPRYGFGRKVIRATYANALQPLVWRAAVGTSPFFVVFGLMVGSLLLVPTSLTGWWILGAIDVMAAGVVLSYRVPPPFMPAFLREEIDRGVTPLARPTRSDWVLLALFVPLVVAANLGFPFLG